MTGRKGKGREGQGKGKGKEEEQKSDVHEQRRGQSTGLLAKKRKDGQIPNTSYLARVHCLCRCRDHLACEASGASSCCMQRAS